MAPKQPPIVLPPNLTLEKLVPVQQLLHLTVHRNKNQHRITKWWGNLQLLRRNIKKLVEMLESKEAEYRRGKEALLKMSNWMAAEIVPRTYLSFSAVVADNQYASLGLMLMGCLARVNACVSFPRSRVSSEEAELGIEVRSTRTNTVIPSEDFGEAITREEEKLEEEIINEAGLGNRKEGKRRKESGGEVGEVSRPLKSSLKREVLDVERSSEEEQRQPPKKFKKMKKVSRKFVEEFDHLSGNSSDEEMVISKKRAKVAETPSSRAETSGSEEEINPAIKKVKNLASSSKAARPSRKKKKKGGDDFDDLFAGLM